jgi:ribosomal protein S4
MTTPLPVYYRNSFTNYNNRCRLWAEISEKYVYRVHDRDNAFLDLQPYNAGFQDFAKGYNYIGGFYYHLKKKKITGPMLLSYLILRPVIVYRRVYGLYKKLYFLVSRFFYRRIYTRLSLDRLHSRVWRCISQHGIYKIKPWERNKLRKRRFSIGGHKTMSRLKNVAPLLLRLTLLFQFKSSFVSKLRRRHVYFKLNKRIRYQIRRFFGMLNKLLQKEIYESISFFNQLPESILSYKKIFSFYEYCIFLLRYFPSRRLSQLKKNRFFNNSSFDFLKGMNTALLIRKGRLWRKQDTRKFRRNIPIQFGKTLLIQIGRKPWKWTVGSVRKRRHRDFKEKGRYRPQQAPFHIENKMHGQRLIFENLASQICEMNQEKVYKFFTRIVQKENVVKLGVLFIAIFRRLDMYLRKFFPRISLRQIRDIINNGVILVNGCIIRDINYVVDLCDVISINLRNTAHDVFFANNLITMFYVIFTMSKHRLRKYLKYRLLILLHRELRLIRLRYLYTFKFRKIWAWSLQRLIGEGARRVRTLSTTDLPRMYMTNSEYAPNFNRNTYTDRIEQYALMRFTFLKRISNIDTLQHIIQYKKVFDFVESMAYVVRSARQYHKPLELYVNPISLNEARTLTRIIRLGYGIIWLKSHNSAARVDEVRRWGFVTYHTSYSYWERFMDSLYDALRLLLPSRLLEVIQYSTHFIIIRHDIDIVKEYRTQMEKFNLPKTSDKYKVPHLFSRFVQDKNLVRRTIAHSPFTTSRRIRYGNSIDNYQTYL